MSMRILKGNVKYKDRSDIVCTYGTLDDGTSYYFMDSTDTKKFTNGNRVATTLLVEAIDPMVKASNIGVIDPDGNVVIPFENKSIKPVDDNVIIVENSTPVSESVIEAINLRNDPLSATKLVSTPATIKEKLNQQMGVEGKYLFNDQFSEATLCDIDGNNLINGERYSFIAQANDKLYMSKNIIDSVINEFSLIPSEIQNNSVADGTEQAIDISTSTMDQNVVENAIDNASSLVSNESAAAVSMPPVVSEDENVNDVDVPVGAMTNDVAPAEGVASDVSIPVDAVASEAAPTEGVASDVSVPVDAVASEAAPAEVPESDVVESSVSTGEDFSDVAVREPTSGEDGPAEPVENEEFNSMYVDNFTSESEVKGDAIEESTITDGESIETSEDTGDVAEGSEIKDSVTDNYDYKGQNDDSNLVESESDTGSSDSFIDEGTAGKLEDMYGIPDTNLDNVFAADDYDVFKNTSVKTDKIVDADDYYTGYTSGFDTSMGGYVQTDNIMTDVAKSMGELISQNRVQRNIINQYKSKIDSYESQLRMVSDRYNDQVEQNEALGNRLRDLSSASSRLEAKNKTLEQKLRDLSRITAAQEKELKVLRPQVQGKQDLVQLLADARAVLGTSDSYGYSEEPSYYRRAA